MPHGVIAAIHLPATPDDIPASALRRLHPEERSVADTLDGHRRVQWIGGRLAARAATKVMGHDLTALLVSPHGAPLSPNGLSISISHKANLAMAIVCKKKHGTVGLDFEIVGRDRSHIAEKILCSDELGAVRALPNQQQWGATLVRFAIKEAIYKSLAPRLQRYIAFDEACIVEFHNGHARVDLRLKSQDGPVSIEALYEWMPEGLIATVRSRWA